MRRPKSNYTKRVIFPSVSDIRTKQDPDGVPKLFRADFEFGKVICADGFTMSVQASEDHYCQPRDNSGPYTKVEVGYPSQPEALLAPYSEYKGVWNDDYSKWREYTRQELIDATTGQVFPYTPVSTVLKVILKHGGIKQCA